MGKILLAGGSEFRGRMADADRLAITMTGKTDPSLVIIPTAAALDNNHVRAGNNGIAWFRSLGVKNVSSLPVVDGPSADNHALAEEIGHADLVYILGGFPGFLAQTLGHSRCGAAIFEAHRRGAVLAGSSAGAMVLCKWFVNPETGKLQSGLGLFPHMVIIPHHEKVGRKWQAIIWDQLPGMVIAGIDEETAMIRQSEAGRWCVRGKGVVTIYRNHAIERYSEHHPGFDLPESGDTPGWRSGNQWR